MSRAVVTFGVGAHRELLDIALPSFHGYAERHGYDDLIVADFDMAGLQRPVSWYKLPILRSALVDHDEVLWLDADVVIVDDSEDIADHVSADRWQGLAVHNSASDGLHPNCGVWLVRRAMLPTLAELWQMTARVNHPWWEQAAMLDLLGYDLRRRPVKPPELPPTLLDRTQLLSSAWNYTPGCANVRRGRFMHAAGAGGHRAGLMRQWAADAQRRSCDLHHQR